MWWGSGKSWTAFYSPLECSCWGSAVGLRIYLQHLFYATPYILQLEHNMFFVCLFISYFARNGFTVDDLGLLLAMTGVMMILIMVVIFRAAVGSFIQRFPPLL